MDLVRESGLCHVSPRF